MSCNEGMNTLTGRVAKEESEYISNNYSKDVVGGKIKQSNNQNKDRRERIATAALQGLLACKGLKEAMAAELAVYYADALIAELDGESE